MRPMMRRLDDISAVPPAPEPPPAPTEQQMQIAAEEAEAAVQGDGYRENLNMAKKLAQEDPRVVANVVKAWVGANG